jgi:hypothetical protein
MSQASRTTLKLPIKPAVRGESGKYERAPGDRLMEAMRRDIAKAKDERNKPRT